MHMKPCTEMEEVSKAQKKSEDCLKQESTVHPIDMYINKYHDYKNNSLAEIHKCLLAAFVKM